MKREELKQIERGDIWVVDFPKIEDDGKRRSVQMGKRPCVIISNEACNKYSPTITVAVLTSRLGKTKLPTHVLLGRESGLRQDSIVLCEQMLTISKEDILFNVGVVPENKMKEIDRASQIQIQPKFDESYIQKLIFQIKKTKELFVQYRDEFLKQLVYNTINELKNYCIGYGKDYRRYLEEKDNYIACA